MKKTISLLFFLLPTFIYAQEKDTSTSDYSECLKKTSSMWGEKCLQCMNFDNSYRVNLANICKETLDVKVAVQEYTKRWRTFLRSELAPDDSVSAYACVGTGKYIFWARKAGDKAVMFPTDEEINQKFVK